MLAHESYQEGERPEIEIRIECAWCGCPMGKRRGEWPSALPAVSHGMCPTCFEQEKKKREEAEADGRR